MPHGLRRLIFALCFIAGLVSPYLLTAIENFAWATHEVQRVASPDLGVDAVSVTFRTGVLTPRLTYEVFIVEHGAPYQNSDLVFSARKIENAELVWTARQCLQIGYSRARIEHFTNYWKLSPARDRPVEIRLAPTSTTFSYLNSSGSIGDATEP
jgi:hypothetical protein